MALRGVIFDLDGTLVDSRLDFPAIRREMGLPAGTSILEDIERIPEGLRRGECLQILERHESEGASRATPISGVPELLAALAAWNIPSAVLTRNSRTCTELVMNRLGLSFSHVVTREDAAPKPDAAGLLRICSLWQVAPAEVVFVGDYLHDIECGRNAVVRTILFAPGGPPSYAALAHYCVGDFGEAARLLRQLALED